MESKLSQRLDAHAQLLAEIRNATSLEALAEAESRISPVCAGNASEVGRLHALASRRLEHLVRCAELGVDP